MSETVSTFQKKLLPGEQLLAVVENLSFSVLFVPHVTPIQNYPCGFGGSLALTNRRIIAALFDGSVWKWFHISAMNSLTERPLNNNRPSWPYQAIMMIPGGIGLVIQTQNPNAEQAKQLQTLLVEGFMKYGVRRDDDGAMAAIIAHEEEEERRRREAEDDRRKRD